MGDTIKARSFALPIKKRVAKTAKRSLKVWKQQQQKQVRLAQILILNLTLISMKLHSQIKTHLQWRV